MSTVSSCPAMVNAHSHAFQRDLRGAAERPGAGGARRRRLLVLARGDVPARRRARPGVDADRRRARLRRDGRGRLRRGRRVPLRPPPARRDAVPGPERDGDRRRRGRASPPGCGSSCSPPPTTAPAGTARRRRASAASATRTSAAYLARVDALRAWADGRPGVGVGVAAHSVRAVPAAWLEAIAAYADQHGLVRHVHAHEQPRELEECREEHGVSPIELLAPDRLPRPAHEPDPRHPRRARRTSAGSPASDTIVVSCPTTEGSLGDGHFPALVYRDAGVRIAIGSDSNVRVDPFEETRELETLARRERRTRHALLARLRRPLGRAGARTAARASGCATPARCAIDRDHPDLRGRRGRRPPAGGRHLRRRPRSSLRQPLHEERLLGGVVGQRERLAVGVGGLGVAPEPVQQVGLRRGQVAVAGEAAVALERLDLRRAPPPARRPSTSATARLSATTGDGQTRSSSS